MASQASNKFKLTLLKGDIDFDTDVFKIILMASGFTFNRVSHSQYSDVSASELPTANGYTVGGNTLAGVAVTQDDTENQGEVAWNNTSWVAAGGALVSSGAIIYDDTVTSPADVLVGYIDFGGDVTTNDGGTHTISNIAVNLA